MQEYIIEPFLNSENTAQQINSKEITDLLSLRPMPLFQPHKTSFYVIHLFCEGEGKHIVDFNTFDVKEKHILFLTQNQINQFQEPIHYKGNVLIFTEDFFCKNSYQKLFFSQTSLFHDFLRVPYFSIKERFEEIISLFRLIQQELTRPYSEIQTSILNNYLFNILIISEQIYEPCKIDMNLTPDKLLVSRFKSLANNSLSHKHNVNYYADKLNVNPRTIQKAFRQTENITPKKWLADRMILEIKRSLLYKEKSISEIAYDLGFNEANHFSKFFKSNTNIAPSAFRENSSL